MKETLAKIRSHMSNDKTQSRKHAIESMKHTAVKAKKHTTSVDATRQAKKDKIMKLVKQTELEYQEKSLPSTVSHKIHAKFEQMKDDLKNVSDIHLLKTKLHSKLEEIKSIEKSSKDLEEW